MNIITPEKYKFQSREILSPYDSYYYEYTVYTYCNFVLKLPPLSKRQTPNFCRILVFISFHRQCLLMPRPLMIMSADFRTHGHLSVQL